MSAIMPYKFRSDLPHVRVNRRTHHRRQPVSSVDQIPPPALESWRQLPVLSGSDDSDLIDLNLRILAEIALDISTDHFGFDTVRREKTALPSWLFAHDDRWLLGCTVRAPY